MVATIEFSALFNKHMNKQQVALAEIQKSSKHAPNTFYVKNLLALADNNNNKNELLRVLRCIMSIFRLNGSVMQR